MELANGASRLVSTFVVLAGCAWGGYAQTPDKPRTEQQLLSGEALRNAIVGTTMQQIDFPNGGESFCFNGGWSSWGGRSPEEGTYTVVDDKVCVKQTGISDPYCYRFSHIKDDVYVIHHIPEDRPASIHGEVRLTPKKRRC